MTPSKDISRETLERHGIFYRSYDPRDDRFFDRSWSSLPDHVDTLREALLAFPRNISDIWKSDYEKESVQYGNKVLGDTDCLQPPDAVYYPRGDFGLRGSKQWSLGYSEKEECSRIAEAARRIKKLNQAEAEWSMLFRNKIFEVFNVEKNSKTEIDFLFDEWSIQQDLHWNEFDDWQKSPDNLTRRTAPKPDLTYGFPILRSPEVLMRGFGRDQYFVQYFSLKVLNKLRLKGLHSAVTTGLRKGTESEDGGMLDTPDLLCYPWAIVEMKKYSRVPPAEVDRCYCQAANASAAALSLQERLYARAFSAAPSNLPPIIAFTCVGPQVKLWLTYRWKGSEGETSIVSSDDKILAALRVTS
ncbi:MAG: hypothetical protein Q9160_007774 [Pyrenula sp. 1 TL-2023]